MLSNEIINSNKCPSQLPNDYKQWISAGSHTCTSTAQPLYLGNNKQEICADDLALARQNSSFEIIQETPSRDLKGLDK